MITYVLKKTDNTVLLTLAADSNLRSPAEKQRRRGRIFETPEGPFVQYADEVAVGDDVIEVYWRLATPAQAEVLRAAARGDHGDELKLGNPYEGNITIAFVPGPEGFEPDRYVGTPPNERLSVTTRFVRLA